MTLEELGNENVRLGEQVKLLTEKVNGLAEKFGVIENLTLSVQKLALSVEQLANNHAEEKEERKKLSDKVIELENSPYKKKAAESEEIRKYIISVVLSFVMGILLSMIFKVK